MQASFVEGRKGADATFPLLPIISENADRQTALFSLRSHGKSRLLARATRSYCRRLPSHQMMGGKKSSGCHTNVFERHELSSAIGSADAASVDSSFPFDRLHQGPKMGMDEPARSFPSVANPGFSFVNADKLAQRGQLMDRSANLLSTLLPRASSICIRYVYIHTPDQIRQ
jgi:hypothetical protein